MVEEEERGPPFSLLFSRSRIDCSAEETKRKRKRRKKGGAKSWGGPADERKTHGRDSFGEGDKKMIVCVGFFTAVRCAGTHTAVDGDTVCVCTCGNVFLKNKNKNEFSSLTDW